MIVTVKELRALNPTLGPRLNELLEPAQFGMPKKTVQRLLSVEWRKFSLASINSMGDISLAVTTLAVYGHLARVFQVAEALAPVPTAEGERSARELTRWSIAVAIYFGTRDGDAERAAALRPALIADGYRPGDNFMTGSLALRRLRPLPAPGSSADDFLFYASGAISTIEHLAVLWAFGGSKLWKPKEIEKEIARIEAELLGVPGYERIG